MKFKKAIVILCSFLTFSNPIIISVNSNEIVGETWQENGTDTTTSNPVENTTTTATTTTVLPPSKTILEIQEDARNDRWEFPEPISKLLEYHHNLTAFKDQANDETSCAYIISDNVTKLPDFEGIWSSCNNLSLSGGMDASIPIHPSIHYSSSGEYIVSVNVNYFLEGVAILRLHVGDECFDYTVLQNSLSPCKFMPVRQDGTYWRGFHWSSINGQKLTEFRVEMVSNRTDFDVILLDRITVEYYPCKPADECPQPTTPGGDTSTGNMRTASCLLLHFTFFLLLLRFATIAN